ncbi:glutamate-cysteine ligase family protein [Achromobacter insuavis]
MEAEGAVLLNASEHPDCTLDPSWYATVHVPRPIYRELVGHREWLHRVGIDAKAQNSPCTSVDVTQAARALNVVLALAPASIAIFANSPLENGRATGLKENRLTVWDRMFRHSRYAGDYHLQRLPERPFVDLGDYFRWMFAPGTASRCLPLATEDGYKSATGVYLRGSPCLSAFLASDGWPGRRSDTGEGVTIAPQGAHFSIRSSPISSMRAGATGWRRRHRWRRCVKPGGGRAASRSCTRNWAPAAISKAARPAPASPMRNCCARRDARWRRRW